MIELVDILLAILGLAIEFVCIGLVGLCVTTFVVGCVELVMLVAHWLTGDRR